MAKLVVTSVVRGSQQGQSHGGIYVVDFDQEKTYQPVDWNTPDIDWRNDEHDRGLRGIAIHRDRVFVAASDALHEFNPNFEHVESYRNPYLKLCHEIDVHGHHVFMTSADFDSIVAFNLRKNAFDLAFMLQTDGQSIAMKRFDPSGDDGPLAMNKFELNSIHCDQGGIYVAGRKTNALLLYNGKRVGISTTLPAGTHNAQPFGDGIIFNDTESQAVRYSTRDGGGDCAFDVGQGLLRGLCPVGENLIAAGCSPATVSLFDLAQKSPQMSAEISTDPQNTVHSITAWPFY